MFQVVECVNGDALVVKTADGQFKKCFLASIKPPRYYQDATSLPPVLFQSQSDHISLF